LEKKKKGVQPITLTTPLSTFLFSRGRATSSLSPLAADQSITFVSHGGDGSISSLSFLFSRGGFQPHHSPFSFLAADFNLITLTSPGSALSPVSFLKLYMFKF
jgi:hypothetical protein